MARHLVIGIHGLNNKPPPGVLAAWWRSSIGEGLARNLDRGDAVFDFALVYWADLLNPAPLDTDPEPYRAAEGTGPLPRHPASRRDSVREAAQGALDKMTAIPKVDVVTATVMSRSTPDLHRYYTEPALRDAIAARFAVALADAHREARRTLVIAHSMGSIIVFDVLARLRRDGHGPRVEHLLTVGSPLGLHEVKQQARERGLAIRVPDVAEHWTNLADRRDRIAFDSRLATDYSENPSGVTVTDTLVVNGYIRPDGRANPHKIYGYLRTPEASEIIHAVIAD